MFDWLLNLLDKLWNWLRKILAIVLIIAAVVLAVYAFFAGGWLFGLYAFMALAGAFLIDADTAASAVGAVGDAIGDAAGAVAEFAGDTASGLLSGVLSTPVGLAAVGFGIWYFFFRGKESDKEKTVNVIEGDDDATQVL